MVSFRFTWNTNFTAVGASQWVQARSTGFLIHLHRCIYCNQISCEMNVPSWFQVQSEWKVQRESRNTDVEDDHSYWLPINLSLLWETGFVSVYLKAEFWLTQKFQPGIHLTSLVACCQENRSEHVMHGCNMLQYVAICCNMLQSCTARWVVYRQCCALEPTSI